MIGFCGPAGKPFLNPQQKKHRQPLGWLVLLVGASHASRLAAGRG